MKGCEKGLKKILESAWDAATMHHADRDKREIVIDTLACGE